MRVAKAYVAGVGATGALVAAALLAFFSLAALFAFNGLPGGLGATDGGAVSVGAGDTDVPEVAAALASAAPAAVAAAPAGAGAGAGGGAGGGADSGGPGVGTPGTGGPEGGGPGTGSPAAPAPSSPTAPTTTSGPVSNTVQGLEQTTKDTTGLDLPLSEATNPITEPLDKTVNQVGGLLGGK